MANSKNFLSDLKSDRCSSTVDVRLMRLWEAECQARWLSFSSEFCSAVVAIAEATAPSLSSGKDEKMTKANVAVAVNLADPRSKQAAEVIGAKREHLVYVLSSAIDFMSFQRYHDTLILTSGGIATCLVTSRPSFLGFDQILILMKKIKSFDSEEKQTSFTLLKFLF
ncbi:hypothetical protein Bca52824_025922 [Brassica carinata]|uniref:VAN3-binding protein-like auxin canalisation domain-containing protein n=1 Tax=Brassica carinata TaxID=52824 RepID=A0A8X7SKN1_BRACI|nr:hypothetical protein Bca52824_025922 [Brassica carinata]